MARRSSGKAKRPQAPAVSLRRLQELTKRELKQLSEKTIKSTYVSMRKAINARIKTFEKAGLAEAVPSDLRSGIEPMAGKSTEEMINQLSIVSAWIRGKNSTLKGFREMQESFREKMQKALPDMDLSDADKMRAYGEFMGEMQERYGEMWHAISSQARNIYRDLTEINEDPYQFMSNYDYWAAQVEKMNEELNRQHKRGGRYSTKLSTYINKLKAGKIK